MTENLEKDFSTGGVLTRDEWDRLLTGDLMDADFSTCAPNPYRIDKLAIAMHNYLSQRKKVWGGMA